MTTNSTIRRAVRLALASSAAATTMYGVAAVAQDAPPQDDAADVGTIVVTGTRIVSPNLQSISPVTAITAEDIGLTGKVRIEDIVNQLPQAFAAQGSAISNGSDGTASVDLRNLGVNRTLVLVNGRRVMPGDPDGGSAADLNQIPLSLVKRVDVLTGGASSVYGADAVAGVVNFIMDTEFEGVRLDANYSFNQHENDNPLGAFPAARGFDLPKKNVSNGYTKDFTFALGIGGPGDRGHAAFYAGYREVDAVLQADFDYSACTLNSSSSNPNLLSCGGSQTADPVGFFVLNPNTGGASDTPTCPDFGCIADFSSGTAVLRPFTLADAFNFGPYNYHQRPDERYTAGVFANFDVSEQAEAYGEVMFMDDRSISQIAPSGSFFNLYEINCDNPLLSASMVNEFCTQFGLGPTESGLAFVGRRNTEGGGRQEDIGHESIRIISGVRGDLTPAWSYDAYFQHGTTKRNSTYLNDFSIIRTGRALAVRIDDRLDANGDPVNAATFGTPQCISFLDGTDPNCLPWNIWQAGGVNTAALEYLQTPLFIRAEARQQIAHADFTGDLTDWIKLPTAESGLAINVGAEYRDERTEFRPDLQYQIGDGAGQGAPTLPTNGDFNVKEGFIEVRLPLIEGKTGAQAVSFESGYRYSEYSVGYETDTYKFGLDWAPIEAVRLRGSFQRAVRSPNVGELFSPQFVGLDGSTDPCAGGIITDPLDPNFGLVPSGNTPEECARSGVTAAQYGNIPENPAGQYNGLLGGNPLLQPESSDTISFGVVFRPNFANLVVAIDYFDIDVEDAISGVFGGQADVYVTECVETGNPALCGLIHRDALGTLWLTPQGFITDTSLNLGGLTAVGYDIQGTYSLNLGGHRLAFNLIGTYLDESTQTPLPGGGTFDCVGFYGNQCGAVVPEWRHSFRTSWDTPWRGLAVDMTWRYIDSVDSERTSSDPQLAGAVSNTDRTLSSRSYIDLTAAMTFAESYTLRIGANNLLDKDPPLASSGTARGNCPTGPCNGNTWPQSYDALGRQWFASVTVDF